MFVIVINLQFVVKQYASEFLKDQLEPDKGHFDRIVGIFRKSSPVKTDSRKIFCRERGMKLFLCLCRLFLKTDARISCLPFGCRISKYNLFFGRSISSLLSEVVVADLNYQLSSFVWRKSHKKKYALIVEMPLLGIHEHGIVQDVAN